MESKEPKGETNKNENKLFDDVMYEMAKKIAIQFLWEQEEKTIKIEIQDGLKRLIQNELDNSKVSRLPIILSDWNDFILAYAKERLKSEIDKIMMEDNFRLMIRELILNHIDKKFNQ